VENREDEDCKGKGLDRIAREEKQQMIRKSWLEDRGDEGVKVRRRGGRKGGSKKSE